MTTEELEALARRLSEKWVFVGWTGDATSAAEQEILQALKEVRRETREEDLRTILDYHEKREVGSLNAAEEIRSELEQEKV